MPILRLRQAEDRGSGAILYRYWDALKADDAWAFLAGARRVRRVNEVMLSSSPGLSTWDADHAGGVGAKPQEYNFKYLGDKNMLAVVHAQNSPEHPCPTDGGATACNEDWEMRHLYVVEVTPRPERITGVLQSKTIVYVDGEGWFNPYVDSYDQKGELWKTQIYLNTYRDRPCPTPRLRSIRSSASSSSPPRVSTCSRESRRRAICGTGHARARMLVHQHGRGGQGFLHD